MDEFPGCLPVSHLRAPGSPTDSANLYATLLPTQGIQACSQEMNFTAVFTVCEDPDSV